jgi:hypothetical protein
VLLAGHPATAATVLAGAALLAALLVAERWRSPRRAAAALVALACAAAIGVALSAPQTLPTLEYLPHTLRAATRAAGRVDVPPVGLPALPLPFLPWSQGSNVAGSEWRLAGNHLESAAGGYAGLVFALVLGPLSFLERRRRRRSVFLLAIAALGAAQALDYPGFDLLWPAWPLRLLQNNRFVLLTSFGLLSLGVVGLDTAWRRRARWRAYLGLPIAALAGLAGWSAWRAWHAAGPHAEWFERVHWTGCAGCGAALLALVALARSGRRTRWLAAALAVAALAELVAFSAGYVTQSARELAYPRIPALARAAEADPHARTLGYACLPASLNLTHRLRDVRGYDGLDPARLVEVLELCRHPQSPRFAYAALQWFFPVQSPLVDLLGVRHFVFRSQPPGEVAVAFQSPGYFVVENPGALPRAFLPRRVETLLEGEALRRLAEPGFEPREVAFVDRATAAVGEVRGSAALLADEPQRVRVDVALETPGVLVLSDLWYPGWCAYRDGEETAVLRANHAFRAVELPAGRSTVEFRYEPRSFRLGLRAAALAILALLAWSGLALARRRQR